MPRYYTPPPDVADVWRLNPELSLAEALFFVQQKSEPQCDKH